MSVGAMNSYVNMSEAAAVDIDWGDTSNYLNFFLVFLGGSLGKRASSLSRFVIYLLRCHKSAPSCHICCQI